jgi:hypothetical protein
MSTCTREQHGRRSILSLGVERAREYARGIDHVHGRLNILANAGGSF